MQDAQCRDCWLESVEWLWTLERPPSYSTALLVCFASCALWISLSPPRDSTLARRIPLKGHAQNKTLHATVYCRLSPHCEHDQLRTVRRVSPLCTCGSFGQSVWLTRESPHSFEFIQRPSPRAIAAAYISLNATSVLSFE